MQELAWGMVIAFAVTTIAFLWLWLQARMAQRAVEQTMSDLSSAMSAPSNGGIFASDNIYKLVAKGQINLGSALHNFGVTQIDGGTPTPFLTSQQMDHLQAGDSLSSIRGALHKVDAGSGPAPAVTTAATKTDFKSPAKPTAVPAPVAPATLADMDDDDNISERTIMFSPSRGSADKATDNPYEGFPVLRVTSGPDTGTDFPLPYTLATIGRDKTNIIALADQGLSRLHCEVRYRRQEFVLRDNNSTNGTRCNDERVTEHVLAFGDSIQIANSIMTFTCDGHELKDSTPDDAIAAFEACLEKEPNFVLALQNLAFLLERNVARQKEAEPLWKRIMEIDQGR